MSDDPISAPSAAEMQETPSPAASEPTVPTGSQEQAPAEPKREPWFQKRIDELTKARREAERRADALEALISAQGQPQTHTPENVPGAPMNDREIQRRAEAIAAQQRLNDEANRVYREGKAKHPDFDVAVSQLIQVTDLSQKPDFLDAVTRLPNGADVYHHLGTHPDHASEILSLRGTALALELAKLSAELGKPKKGSGAPPPISPVGSSAVSSGDLTDDLPIGEWIRRREASLAKK